MPSREIVPWREPPGGPEPQAIAAFVLCAAGQREWMLGRADGVGGSLGCLLAHSFVRQGVAPERLQSISEDPPPERLGGYAMRMNFFATPGAQEISPDVC